MMVRENHELIQSSRLVKDLGITPYNSSLLVASLSITGLPASSSVVLEE
jgi:hypothetical protein